MAVEGAHTSPRPKERTSSGAKCTPPSCRSPGRGAGRRRCRPSSGRERPILPLAATSGRGEDGNGAREHRERGWGKGRRHARSRRSRRGAGRRPDLRAGSRRHGRGKKRKRQRGEDHAEPPRHASPSPAGRRAGVGLLGELPAVARKRDREGDGRNEG
jgi:hypothetical protein